MHDNIMIINNISRYDMLIPLSKEQKIPNTRYLLMFPRNKYFFSDVFSV